MQTLQKTLSVECTRFSFTKVKLGRLTDVQIILLSTSTWPTNISYIIYHSYTCKYKLMSEYVLHLDNCPSRIFHCDTKILYLKLSICVLKHSICLSELLYCIKALSLNWTANWPLVLFFLYLTGISYPVGIVPPRTKSPVPDSSSIASYVTLRKSKKPDPRTVSPWT